MSRGRVSSAPTSPSALRPCGFTVSGTNKDVFGALEPPEAEEEAQATAGTRPRVPGKGPVWARRAEQTAARGPGWRPGGSRAHSRAHRGKDIETAGSRRGRLEQPADTAADSDAQRQCLHPAKTQSSGAAQEDARSIRKKECRKIARKGEEKLRSENHKR